MSTRSNALETGPVSKLQTPQLPPVIPDNNYVSVYETNVKFAVYIPVSMSRWAIAKVCMNFNKGRPSIIDSLVTVIIDGEIIKHVEDRQDSQRRPNQGNTTACLFAKRHLFSLLGIPGPQPSIYLHRTPCLCLLGYRSDCYHLLLILIAKLEESSYPIIFCWKLYFRRVRKEQNNELVHTQGDKVRTYFGRKQEPGT